MGFSFSYHFSFFPRDIFSCSAASSTISPSTSVLFFLSLLIHNRKSPTPPLCVHTQSSLNHTCLVLPPLSSTTYIMRLDASQYIYMSMDPLFFLFLLYIFLSISVVYIKKNFFLLACFVFIAGLYHDFLHLSFPLSITLSPFSSTRSEYLGTHTHNISKIEKRRKEREVKKKKKTAPPSFTYVNVASSEREGGTIEWNRKERKGKFYFKFFSKKI